MNIIRQKYIDRSDLRNNPDLLYVFGDNLTRQGLGGQAHAMRGEPNAIGVATLAAPGEPFLFTAECREKIWDDLWDVEAQMDTGPWKGLVWPTDGIGTGLANMPPTLRAWMDDHIFDAFGIFNELK